MLLYCKHKNATNPTLYHKQEHLQVFFCDCVKLSDLACGRKRVCFGSASRVSTVFCGGWRRMNCCIRDCRIFVAVGMYGHITNSGLLRFPVYLCRPQQSARGIGQVDLCYLVFHDSPNLGGLGVGKTRLGIEYFRGSL